MIYGQDNDNIPILRGPGDSDDNVDSDMTVPTLRGPGTGHNYFQLNMTTLV